MTDTDDMGVYPAEYFDTPFTKNYSPCNAQKDKPMTIEKVIKDPRFKTILNEYYAGAIAFMEKAGSPKFIISYEKPPVKIKGDELIRKRDAIAIAEAWEDAAIGNRDMETAATAQHIASAIFALEPVVVDTP